ncbi:AlpA family transcriptional regulator [Sulfurospirillum sp. hDNRA2]|uniref:helix-turn-helix transcriptional regulator n=1 Tax=Sulfurospirillum sp. hDNRA2 TaxID=3237298 RepID=UPI0020B8E13E|nr:helix-turn-helix domain-containing protein [Sulfurospirillum sp. DNRA8]MCP3651234.1 helix-turn-helix domain-containing protein [Sulfurospirillum sp. DNRA8]MCR1810080.1 helix-turn-helix domain-containing protein [Sulfurospirillum sp. DNRA8]
MIEMENINLIKAMAQDIELIKKALENQTAKRWLNVKELSTYLGYSKDHIYKLKEDTFIEGVHFYKKTGKIIFDRVTIDSWVVGKENTDDINQSRRQIVDNVLLSIQKVS